MLKTVWSRQVLALMILMAVSACGKDKDDSKSSLAPGVTTSSAGASTDKFGLFSVQPTNADGTLYGVWALPTETQYGVRIDMRIKITTDSMMATAKCSGFGRTVFVNVETPISVRATSTTEGTITSHRTVKDVQNSTRDGQTINCDAQLQQGMASYKVERNRIYFDGDSTALTKVSNQ